MAAVDKAFRAEYSKSDRATCRHCTVFIAKDTLRYAQLVRVRIRHPQLLRPLRIQNPWYPPARREAAG
jgi:hypothetical protein